MNKPIIAVDVDDVLLPHFAGLSKWYNTNFGTHLTEDHNHPTDLTPWGVTTLEEGVRRAHGYFDSDDFKSEQPYEAAITVLKKLAEEYELVVVTGRDEIIEVATEQWIQRHFPKLFREIHFTHQYNLEGKSRSKSSVIQDIGGQYFIDDYPNAVFEVAESGIASILFGDYGWNRDSRELPAMVTRCKDWPAVLEYFDAIA